MSEARENYDKYTRHMVDKESTIGKYISELEQQNNELRESQLNLAQEVLEWRSRFNECTKELSEVTGQKRFQVVEETKEQIISKSEVLK